MKKRQIFSIAMIALLTAALAAGLFPAGVQAQSAAPKVVTVSLDGPLSPVWQGILQRGIDLAENNQAQLLLVELNTTGGSIDLMKTLVTMMLDCKVPVVVYVTPQGGMAASAGTLLVMAGRISAMAPNTIIGAASPVGAQGEDIGTTEATKTKQAMKALARDLAASRGPAAVTLAEQAIDEAKAASAAEALQAGLIDYIAKDRQELFAELNGRMVEMNGKSFTLQTTGAEVITTPITLVENVLALLTNPNIVFLLLAIGAQAILIEISTPGGWVAGFVGAVLLALSFYGLGLLPVNWFGLIFMAIAFVLFILDIKAPTHGALTAAGTASFIAGGLILFNSASVPSFANASVGLVVGWGLFLGASFFAVVMLAVRAMKAPIITGRESMIGKEGSAVTEIGYSGIASVNGEQWSARLAEGSRPLSPGERLVVTEVQGLKLVVRKKREG